MFTLNCKGRLLELNEPIVMGIINATPDSFYSGSRQPSVEACVRLALQMNEQGAGILDIGGQSTRPDSSLLSAQEEVERVIPVIEKIREVLPDIFISVDTFYASVAEQAVNAGADIVNDISGGHADENMLSVVAASGVPYICMHMRGTPQTMTQFTAYDDLLQDISAYFLERIEACKRAGIKDLILDPGFGFAKNIEQNFQLLNAMEIFKIFNLPILAGLSRKSTVYKTLGITPEQSLNGTTVLNTVALMKGANILRVHDVKEANEAIVLTQRLKK